MSVTLWLEPSEKGSKVMLSKSFERFLLPISNMHAGGGGVSYSTKQFSASCGLSCNAPQFDTVYLEVVSAPTGLVLSPTRSPDFRFPTVTCVSD